MSHAPNASPKETQHDPFANQLSRLKKQWHKEWEEEFLRKNVHYDYKKVTESNNTKLDTMRERWIEGMTPRTRARFEAFDQAEAEDDEAKQARWRLPAPTRGQAVAASHPAAPDNQPEDDQ